MCCPLAWVVDGVQYQKANATLTKLNINENSVGDGGASALADALKATVLTCKKCVFRTLSPFYRKCRFTKSCEELESSTCSAVCVGTFVIFSCDLSEHVHAGVWRRLCARVVLKFMCGTVSDPNWNDRVLSCRWSARHWHLLARNTPPQRVLVAPCDVRGVV